MRRVSNVPPLPSAAPAAHVLDIDANPLPGWVRLLGVWSIVVGGAGGALALVALANMLMVSGIGKLNVPVITQANTALGTRAITTMTVVDLKPAVTVLILGSTALNIGAAALAIIGGVQMLRRRAPARKTLLTWAVLKLPVEALLAVAGYAMMSVMFERMYSGMSNMPPMMISAMVAMSVGFNLAAGLATPVFMLIALNLKRVRSAIDASLAQRNAGVVAHHPT
jgi:hypothetical protein